MKKVFVILIIYSGFILAGEPPADKARGFFVAFGVGPRLPVGEFSATSDLGYGFNIEFSYTDNEYLPFFLFAKIGFETFPGSQDFYKGSDYSNFSTNALPVQLGVRYYFPPFLEAGGVILIPFAEAAVAYTYYEKLHQFKIESGRTNFLEGNSKAGFAFSGGISMFLMEIMASYSYFETNQFLSFDLKIRLPLFINI